LGIVVKICVTLCVALQVVDEILSDVLFFIANFRGICCLYGPNFKQKSFSNTIFYSSVST